MDTGAPPLAYRVDRTRSDGTSREQSRNLFFCIHIKSPCLAAIIAGLMFVNMAHIFVISSFSSFFLLTSIIGCNGWYLEWNHCLMFNIENLHDKTKGNKSIVPRRILCIRTSSRRLPLPFLHLGPSRSVMDGCEPRPSGKPNLERSGATMGPALACRSTLKHRHPRDPTCI